MHHFYLLHFSVHWILHTPKKKLSREKRDVRMRRRGGGSCVCVCRDETQIHSQIDKKVAIFNFGGGWGKNFHSKIFEPVELNFHIMEIFLPRSLSLLLYSSHALIEGFKIFIIFTTTHHHIHFFSSCCSIMWEICRKENCIFLMAMIYNREMNAYSGHRLLCQKNSFLIESFCPPLNFQYRKSSQILN